VVVYTEDDKRVLLSLRQADILKALASDTELTSQGGGVPDIQDTNAAQYDNSHPDLGSMSSILTYRQAQGSSPCFPPRVWQIHA
jgi:hypothetical protein